MWIEERAEAISGAVQPPELIGLAFDATIRHDAATSAPGQSRTTAQGRRKEHADYGATVTPSKVAVAVLLVS